MKLLFAMSAACAALVLPATVLAQDAAKLAQTKACMACHSVDRKVVGPSYKEVAVKYRSDKAAKAMVIKMETNVAPCKISTVVKEEDSGKYESMMYLLPTAANNPPTGNANLDSVCSESTQKLTIEIAKATYIPRKILKNNPHAERSNLM